MNKATYVEVQKAMDKVTPKGQWLDVVISRKGSEVTMTAQSQDSDFKVGMRDSPCGSNQECKKELSEGKSCYGGCEYHQNFLNAKEK